MSSIYIPEPCHENWGKMSPTEKGRFCAVCTKEVVDFTKKLDEEIVAHVKKADDKTCGVFLPSQLHEPSQLSLSKSPWEFRLKKWMVSSLAMVGLFSLSKQSSAQKMGKVAIRGDVAFVEDHNTTKEESVVYGQVLDQNDKPVSGATVSIYYEGEFIADTTTIANGAFRFVIPAGKVLNGKIDIQASGNWKYKEVSGLQLKQRNTRIQLKLEEEIIIMGEIAYVDPIPQIDTALTDTTETIPADTLPIQHEIDTAEQNTCNEILEEPITSDTSQTTEVIGLTPRIDILIREEEALIYPNPGRDLLFIETPLDGEHLIEVFDPNGKLIHHKIFNGTKSSIEGLHLAPGFYTVKITTGTKSESKTWVVM
jgi:hypothetical protein